MTVPRLREKRQSGQSMVEFAFLIPVVLVFLGFMVEVNMAINSAIVYNRHARAHLHYLFFNSRYYPEVKFLKLGKGTFMQRFWVGVDDRPDNNAQGSPKAPTIKIGRVKPSDDDTPGEVSSRQNVRIKVTAFTCVPPLGSTSDKPFSEGHMNEATFTTPGPGFCDEGN